MSKARKKAIPSEYMMDQKTLQNMADNLFASDIKKVASAASLMGNVEETQRNKLQQNFQLSGVLLFSADDQLANDMQHINWSIINPEMAASMTATSFRQEAWKNFPLDWVEVARDPSKDYNYHAYGNRFNDYDCSWFSHMILKRQMFQEFGWMHSSSRISELPGNCFRAFTQFVVDSGLVDGQTMIDNVDMGGARKRVRVVDAALVNDCEEILVHLLPRCQWTTPEQGQHTLMALSFLYGRQTDVDDKTLTAVAKKALACQPDLNATSLINVEIRYTKQTRDLPLYAIMARELAHVNDHPKTKKSAWGSILCKAVVSHIGGLEEEQKIQLYRWMDETNDGSLMAVMFQDSDGSSNWQNLYFLPELCQSSPGVRSIVAQQLFDELLSRFTKQDRWRDGLFPQGTLDLSRFPDLQGHLTGEHLQQLMQVIAQGPALRDFCASGDDKKILAELSLLWSQECQPALAQMVKILSQKADKEAQVQNREMHFHLLAKDIAEGTEHKHRPTRKI